MFVTTTTVYPVMKGRQEVTFMCPECLRKNRKRAFTVEYTVNPFNKNDDGSVRTPVEVRWMADIDARLQRDQFLKSPLCKGCEDQLSFSERKLLIERRKAI